MEQGLKDRDLQDYYESMIEMFSTKGWQYFVEDMQKLFEKADSVQSVNGLQHLGFRQGQVDIIKVVISQPAVVHGAYDELLRTDDDDAESV